MKRFSTTLLLAASLAAAPAFATAASDLTARQKEVAQRGRDVMPFSLLATTHVFSKTADGGVQQVVTMQDDPKQVALIRQHLAMIAQQFAAGGFAGPEHIHGKDMPGLAALRSAKPGELKITYRDLPNGGAIAYQTDRPRLVGRIKSVTVAKVNVSTHPVISVRFAPSLAE